MYIHDIIIIYYSYDTTEKEVNPVSPNVETSECKDENNTVLIEK